MTVRMILGAVAGAVFGFVQYKWVGCQTGACPLVGNPFTAVFMWGLIGGMVGAGT